MRYLYSGSSSGIFDLEHVNQLASRDCEEKHARQLALCQHSYLAEIVYKVVLQKSIPAQIRQLILYIGHNTGYVDGFARELAFAKRPFKHFQRDTHAAVVSDRVRVKREELKRFQGTHADVPGAEPEGVHRQGRNLRCGVREKDLQDCQPCWRVGGLVSEEGRCTHNKPSLWGCTPV